MAHAGHYTENAQAKHSRKAFQWGTLFVLWTIPGLLCALQVYTGGVLVRGQPYTWGAILWYALPVWWLWIPFTLVALVLARRFPLERGRLLRGLLVHVPASLILTVLHLAFYAYWIEVAAPYATRPMSLFGRTLALANNVWLHVDLLAYGAILGGYYALTYYRTAQERLLRASQLETRLAEARLQALRMQLHPHFLFNTLNAISTLILKQDHDTAIEMLTHLSDFLRTTLEEQTHPEVPLERELAFAEQYLAIERCRFGERLHVEVDVEPETLSALVPGLILQPLVENAVRYGIAPQETRGRLVLRAHRHDDRLRLEVKDDGPGFSARASSSGIGLVNTQARLKQRYGSDHLFAITNGTDGGTRVTIDLPFERAPLPQAHSSSAPASPEPVIG